MAKRMVTNALRGQRNLLSSDDEAATVPQVGKKRLREEMHGATLVPEPAYLKHKRLLNKKF